MLTVDDLRRGCRAFEARESRDAMYKVASRLVREDWPAMMEVADGLGVLLLTWNEAFYRYGRFDFDALERTLVAEQAGLEGFRVRHLHTFRRTDEVEVQRLFKVFLEALQISEGKKKGTQSPVSCAKALHLLAPEFFPLWDNDIADGYGCYWGRSADSPAPYAAFMREIKKVLASVEGGFRSRKGPDGGSLHEELQAEARFPKPLLKFIDEYNYAKFTKGWI